MIAKKMCCLYILVKKHCSKILSIFNYLVSFVRMLFFENWNYVCSEEYVKRNIIVLEVFIEKFVRNMLTHWIFKLCPKLFVQNWENKISFAIFPHFTQICFFFSFNFNVFNYYVCFLYLHICFNDSIRKYSFTYFSKFCSIFK